MILWGAVCAGMKTMAVHLPEAGEVAARVLGVMGTVGLAARS